MTSDTPDGLAPLPDLGGDMAPMEGGLPDLGTPMGGGELPDIGSPMGGQMPAMGGDMPSLGNEMPVMGEAAAAPLMPMATQPPQAPLNERRDDAEGSQYKRSIYALPVDLQVVIGTARPTIAELLKMKAGSLLALGSKIEDPVDLCIDNRVIARGELVETDPATGGIGVRLTEIVDISEDMLA